MPLNPKQTAQLYATMKGTSQQAIPKSAIASVSARSRRISTSPPGDVGETAGAAPLISADDDGTSPVDGDDDNQDAAGSTGAENTSSIKERKRSREQNKNEDAEEEAEESRASRAHRRTRNNKKLRFDESDDEETAAAPKSGRAGHFRNVLEAENVFTRVKDERHRAEEIQMRDDELRLQTQRLELDRFSLCLETQRVLHESERDRLTTYETYFRIRRELKATPDEPLFKAIPKPYENVPESVWAVLEGELLESIIAFPSIAPRPEREAQGAPPFTFIGMSTRRPRMSLASHPCCSPPLLLVPPGPRRGSCCICPNTPMS